MRRAVLFLVLILAACGGDGETSSTVAHFPDLTTLPPATSPPARSTSTSTTTTSTTTTSTTTTLPPNAVAEYGLSHVVFGDNPLIIITNWGNAPGTLDGHWLGQGTAFAALPPIELNPGEQALIGLGDTPPLVLAGIAATEHLGPVLGGFPVTGGEVGLFSSDDFDEPSSVVAYVAWGTAEQPIATVAVAAGVWGERTVVTTDEDPSISSGVFPATTSDDWFTDIGG